MNLCTLIFRKEHSAVAIALDKGELQRYYGGEFIHNADRLR